MTGKRLVKGDSRPVGAAVTTSEKILPFEKIIILAIIFLSFVLVTILSKHTLPLWQYGISLLIVLLAMAWLIYTQGTPQPGQAPATDWKSRIFGASKPVLILVLVVLIILAAYWHMIWPIASALFGWNLADKTFGPEEFRTQGVCYGGCQVDSTGVTLSYGGSIFLNDTEKMSIGRIVVYPESLPEGSEVWIRIGSYKFQTVAFGKNYIGRIFSPKEEISNQPCAGCLPVKDSDKGLPILIETNDLDIFPFGLFRGVGSESPAMKILWERSQEVFGSSFLVTAYWRGDDSPTIKGGVYIASASGGTIKIKEARIYKGSLWQRLTFMWS